VCYLDVKWFCKVRIHLESTRVDVVNGSVDCDGADLEASQDFAEMHSFDVGIRTLLISLKETQRCHYEFMKISYILQL